MKKHKVSYIIVGGVFLFFVIKGTIESSHSRCDVLNEFMPYNYNGLVIDKYVDSNNHSTKTVIIKNFDESVPDTLDLLDWDTTGVYYEINKNDTIYKKQGTNTIHLSNKNGKSAYTLDFGCNKKK